MCSTFECSMLALLPANDCSSALVLVWSGQSIRLCTELCHCLVINCSTNSSDLKEVAPSTRHVSLTKFCCLLVCKRSQTMEWHHKARLYSTTNTMSPIKFGSWTALCGIFFRENKHQKLMRRRHGIVGFARWTTVTGITSSNTWSKQQRQRNVRPRKDSPSPNPSPHTVNIWNLLKENYWHWSLLSWYSQFFLWLPAF